MFPQLFKLLVSCGIMRACKLVLLYKRMKIFRGQSLPLFLFFYFLGGGIYQPVINYNDYTGRGSI